MIDGWVANSIIHAHVKKNKLETRKDFKDHFYVKSYILFDNENAISTYVCVCVCVSAADVVVVVVASFLWIFQR